MAAIEHVKIFDTTLRDGQQCPGAGMDFEKNLEYAELAAQLGVDILEAGFPAASKVDHEIVRTIAEKLAGEKSSPIIAALCQLRDEQIDITIDALQPAIRYGKGRLHVYVPVDPNLMIASLGVKADKGAIQNNLNLFVKRAVQAGLEVQFSPEGYSRMGENFGFTLDLIRAAIEGGATTINCPDTIGGANKFQGAEYFVEKMNQHARAIREEYPTRDITWSTHCHNDFGLAVENSINAVFHGPARQIEGCINGIGERAGNASLEQCIMLIKHFPQDLSGVGVERHFATKIRTEMIQTISDFVHRNMLRRQAHFPICGENAAKHSSGGHTNAVLKDPLVYQPFDPKETGNEVSLLFGPLSGGNHAKAIVESRGYVCDETEKTTIAQFAKNVYKERRKGVTDDELLESYFEFRKPMNIVSFDYSRSADRSEIIIVGKFFEKEGEIREAHQGKDSALAALKSAIDREFPGTEIQNHQSVSEGEGIAALSLSSIIVKDSSGNFFEGVGRDRDIEISAMKALIDAVNRAYIDKHYRHDDAAKLNFIVAARQAESSRAERLR